MATPNPPEDSPEKRRTPDDDRTPEGDDTPATPPTEPERPPVEEPPDERKRAPYIVARRGPDFAVDGARFD